MCLIKLCASYSSLSAPQILEFLFKLTEKCKDLGMDISHEPTFFNHATTYSHHTSIENCLLTVREFFCGQKKEMTKLLVVVQDSAAYYDDDLNYWRQNFGVAYYSCCCPPEPNEEFLMRVASEMMFKALKVTAYESNVYSLDEEMQEDDGGMDADPQVERSVDTPFADSDIQITKGTVENWVCVCFAPLPEHKVYRFSEKLRHKCVSLGMDVCLFPKVFFKENPSRWQDIGGELWTVYSKNHTNLSKIDLLTIILPQEKEFHVKIEEACNQMGVVCQYFWPMSVISPRMKYLGKAAREIRSKVTRLQTGKLQQPSVCKPFQSPEVGPIILFGAGVSHGISSQAVSLVASMNWPEIIAYNGSAICSKELTIDYSSARVFLEKFCEYNGKRAERIIFFRHVESPLNKPIVDGDLYALKKACSSISVEYQPPITYIAVSTNKTTVCDDVGLNSTMFVFSCDPWDEETAIAHYGVFLDENSFAPSVLESFCLSLCTPFYRWVMPAMPMVPPASIAATLAQNELKPREVV